MAQILYVMKVPAKGDASERLERLGRCFSDYAERTGLSYSKEEFLDSLYKGEFGKPETKCPKVHFNISHSKDYWCVLFSDQVCGVDIQYQDERPVEKIVNRFFHPFEKEWVENGGAEAFFRIWARKESYLKFLGCGFSKGYSESDMLDERGLLAEKSGGFFQEIEGPEGYSLCVCSASREPVQVEEIV